MRTVYFIFRPKASKFVFSAQFGATAQKPNMPYARCREILDSGHNMHMAYFNYHAKAQSLIQSGHCIKAEIVRQYKEIAQQDYSVARYILGSIILSADIRVGAYENGAILDETHLLKLLDFSRFENTLAAECRLLPNKQITGFCRFFRQCGKKFYSLQNNFIG